MTALYDTIGVGYAKCRMPDPRIANAIHRALGEAKSVLNVGAGAGSYEPLDRDITALEPSSEMIGQRPAGSAKIIQGTAEALPFQDNSFDAAMAVLTVHHWSDVEAGLREMQRVSKGNVVIFTFDPAGPYFWLADYIPEIIALDQPTMPALSTYQRILGPVDMEEVPIPHDCVDGFLGAYWRRPEAYLDPHVRAAISTFSKLGNIAPALEKLEHDLRSGDWAKQYGKIETRENLDIGYRLITTRN